MRVWLGILLLLVANTAQAVPALRLNCGTIGTAKQKGQKIICKANPNVTPTPTVGPSAIPTCTPPSTVTVTATATVTTTVTVTMTVTASPTPTATPTAAPTGAPLPPLTRLAQWSSNMTMYGTTWCEFLKNAANGFDPRLAATYYDGSRVYKQIYTHTNNTAYWLTCVNASTAVYRNLYVTPNGGNVPGYWNFSRGLYWEGDNATVQLLAMNAAFSRDSTPETIEDVQYMREVAYALQAHLDARKAGYPAREYTTRLLAAGRGHIRKYFIDHTAQYYKPFMVALMLESLIDWATYSAGTVPDIDELVTAAANGMWNEMWRESAQAFLYLDDPGSSEEGNHQPAPDLNLLIAPVYAWLWQRTHVTDWITKGDKIFNGGVAQAWLGAGKQFNQNYRWSPQYVLWRAQ